MRWSSKGRKEVSSHHRTAQKGVNQLFACAVQYPGLHPLMEQYARLAMRQYEQYTNLSDEQCALPGSFAVFALGMLGQEWRQLVWDYLDLCDDEHSHLQENSSGSM